MNHRRIIAKIFVACALFFFSAQGHAQGVTTSILSGRVSDRAGNPIDGATVSLTHTQTGTTYGCITQSEGFYQISNLRVGGPYSLVFQHVAFATRVFEDIYLRLNETTSINVKLKEESTLLDEAIIIHESTGLFVPEQKGYATNIDAEQIRAMPSIKRSQMDLTRLSPAADGYSFGGRNNLFNNFSIDGSIFNNLFGLEYATPGGQADAQPVALDAIEQVQVSIAPFDVRQGGFTGAGVNAVTKTGTNSIQASVYNYYKNEKLIGRKVGNAIVPNTDFNALQHGFTIGGPIVKNKMFYFTSIERETRNELAHGWLADNGNNTGQSNVNTVKESDLLSIQSRLRDYWGYDPGAYQGYYHQKLNHKILTKFDWNISKNHSLSIRYIGLDAWKDILPHPEAVIGRGPTAYRMPFENSSARVHNSIHSVVGEWTSFYKHTWTNKLVAGFTAFRDTREPRSEPFPVIDIFDSNGNLAITMGSEMFSTNNVLNQDVFHLVNDLVYFIDKHSITGGISAELFRFENCFNLFYYPWDQFNSVSAFLENRKTGDPDYDPDRDIDFNGQVEDAQGKPYNWSYLNVAQVAAYLQEDFKVNPKFSISAGLRVDIPVYLDQTEINEAVEEARSFQGWLDESGQAAVVDPGKWPQSKPLWSPRIGFKWDVLPGSMVQIHGGTGVFTGRIPFVWVGNQASNPGIYPAYTFQVNASSEHFRFPQVWKSNIAIDWEINQQLTLSFDGVLGKDINAVVHKNFNMAQPTGKLTGTGDNRPIFSSFAEANIYSSSPEAIGFLDAGAIVLDNTNKGYQHFITMSLDWKTDFGLNLHSAYTYLNSKDLTSIPAEIAADAFQRNPVAGNPNRPAISWSRYGLNHRAISSAYYSIDYGSMTSAIGLFMEAGQGRRYSYVYAGDLNQDLIVNNDLLYVPSNSGDVNFGHVDENGIGHLAEDASDQWAALSAYIEQDHYLSTRKGEYAERNGASLPWFAQIDFRYLHDFRFRTGKIINRIQLSLDIMNLGNLLIANWGVHHLPTTTTPINAQGVDNDGVPYFSFNEELRESYTPDVSIRSKWQIQLGIRYIFN